MKTIRQWERQFLLLYGRRNECRFRRGLAERIGFLHLACQALATAVRKKQHQLIPGCLARIVARTLAVTQHFSGLPFVELLARKWAAGKCPYCGKATCGCQQERRPQPQLARSSAKARRLTFKQLCGRLNNVYGENNRAEGVWWILQRLTEEVNELAHLEYELEEEPLTPEEMRAEFALEAADVIAWTVAMANFFSVDLDAALEKRYGTVCWHCTHCPCDCLLNTRKRRPRRQRPLHARPASG